MRLLAIIHQPDAGPGVFAHAAVEAGAELDHWLIASGDRPPSDPRRYDGVLSFGGAMHADQEDEHPWLVTEKLLLRELLGQGTPLLCVCLGAQLLAEAAGASARRARVPEIGWYEVKTTAAARQDPLMGALRPGFLALEWHGYEFSTPPGAVALASSDVCLQGFRAGATGWGIQFHAEVTPRDFDRWLDDYQSDPDAIALGVDPERLRLQARDLMADWNDLGRRLCSRFLQLVAAR